MQINSFRIMRCHRFIFQHTMICSRSSFSIHPVNQMPQQTSNATPLAFNIQQRTVWCKVTDNSELFGSKQKERSQHRTWGSEQPITNIPVARTFAETTLIVQTCNWIWSDHHANIPLYMNRWAHNWQTHFKPNPRAITREKNWSIFFQYGFAKCGWSIQNKHADQHSSGVMAS